MEFRGHRRIKGNAEELGRLMIAPYKCHLTHPPMAAIICFVISHFVTRLEKMTLMLPKIDGDY